jgi:hypothetical protein
MKVWVELRIAFDFIWGLICGEMDVFLIKAANKTVKDGVDGSILTSEGGQSQIGVLTYLVTVSALRWKRSCKLRLLYPVHAKWRKMANFSSAGTNFMFTRPEKTCSSKRS